MPSVAGLRACVQQWSKDPLFHNGDVEVGGRKHWVVVTWMHVLIEDTEDAVTAFNRAEDTLGMRDNEVKRTKFVFAQRRLMREGARARERKGARAKRRAYEASDPGVCYGYAFIRFF